MNETVLFVDDEKQILRSVKRLFVGSNYNVFTAESGEEALSILSRKAVDLIIVDVNMPGMDGYTVLKEVKEKYPSTVRLVLSGHVDENTLLKIQKECLAKSYHYKPWKNQEMLDTIEDIFTAKKILKNKNQFEAINEIDFLPFSKSIYNKFNSLVDMGEDIEAITKVIESDPSITAKVLQAANSVLCGIKTGSVSQAIAYLGMAYVKNILLIAGLYREGDNIKDENINRDMDIIWQHAVLTNKILSFLYPRLLNKKIPDDCSMAGLLHDIGKIVLISTHTEEYIKASHLINNNNKLYYYEEMEFMNTTHSELGAYLLNWWELPFPITESVLFHHDPMNEKIINKELVSLLNIAGIYSWKLMGERNSIEIDTKVLERLNLSKKDSGNLLKEIENNVKHL